MEKLIFLIVYTTISQFILAQDYIPLVEENTHYVYEVRHYDDAGFPLWVDKAYVISIEADTIVEGTLFNKIFKRDLLLTGEMGGIYQPFTIIKEELIGIIRENVFEQRVYVKSINNGNFWNCYSTENLLFDFDLKVGDTLNQCVIDHIQYEDDIIPIVDSVSITSLYGFDRNTINTTGEITYLYLSGKPEQVKIIEGFGYLNYGIYNTSRKKEIIQYCKGTLFNCGIVTEVKEYANNTLLSLFPNPAHNELNFVSSTNKNFNLKINIFNNQGKLLLSDARESINKSKLDISALSPGIYIARLQTNELIYSIQFIKI
jgi:hypothetical protein